MAGRRIATAALLALAAGGCGQSHPRFHLAGHRDNVVVVLIDTLRQDHLATYGYSRDTAPFLGQLARQGAVFDGITPAAWTKPAVASLLTGLHPLRHQALDRMDRLPDAAVPLAERLRRAGYSTLGASANGWISPAFGFDRGFDTFLYDDNVKAAALNRMLLPRLDRLRPPFFLYVHYIDPHIPYDPEVGWDGRPLPAGLRARPVTIAEIDAPHFVPRPPQLMARARDLYDGEIRGTDEALRALVGGLAQRGLMQDTLLVVAADHGEELGDHGRMSHGQSVYQEILRVPLVIHEPRRVPAGRFGRASLLDVVPTLLDLLGLGPPAGRLDGQSLAARLAPAHPGRPADDDRPFLSHLDFVDGTGLALIYGRWKLVLGKNPYRKELFDLDADPGEQRDLLGNPEGAGPFARLAGELAARYNAYSRAALERSTIQMEDRLVRRLADLGYVAAGHSLPGRRIPRRIGPPDPYPEGRLGWAGPGSIGPCAQVGKKEGMDLPLLGGWYEPDGTGRWSAQSGSLILGVPPTPVPELLVEGTNFRTAPVKVTLSVNHRQVLEIELPGGPFRLAAPLAGIPLKDPSLVEIATDSAFLPARQGLPDNRSLGLYVTDVCLQPDTQGAARGAG